MHRVTGLKPDRGIGPRTWGSLRDTPATTQVCPKSTHSLAESTGSLGQGLHLNQCLVRLTAPHTATSDLLPWSGDSRGQQVEALSLPSGALGLISAARGAPGPHSALRVTVP